MSDQEPQLTRELIAQYCDDAGIDPISVGESLVYYPPITRVEVIDDTGRAYVNWEDNNDITYQLQDGGRTLKVFVKRT